MNCGDHSQRAGISLEEIVSFLNHYLGTHEFAGDINGIYRPSTRPIYSLGLGLEPCPQLADWVHRNSIDAIFLHRPWDLELEALPFDLGICAYHLAFDERLTIGFNPRLATALSLSELEEIGEKQGRSIGMLGVIPAQDFEVYRRQVEAVFGGQEQIRTLAQTTVTRVAVVGAMTDELVREAAERGAQVYITGQLRKPAERAIEATGMGVIAVGHGRSETWGLRALKSILHERWAFLNLSLFPDP